MIEEKEYFVMVGDLLLQNYGGYKSDNVIMVDLSTNEEYALTFENFKKAKKVAEDVGKAVSSTNCRVVKKVVKTMYVSVETEG